MALLSLAGGVFGAFGAIQEGRIAEAQGKFAKEIAVRNQQALERQARAEREAASIEETRIARREKLLKGRQRAVVGKTSAGLVGATLSTLTDTAFQFSIDRNLALRRGLIRSRELKRRGQIELAKGRFAFSMGKAAKRLSYFKAGVSILGSVYSSGLFSKTSSTTSTMSDLLPHEKTRSFSGGSLSIPR